MKGLELTATKQHGRTLIQYELAVDETYDDRVSDKVAQLAHILPFQYKEEDGRRILTSYADEEMTLRTLQMQPLQKKEVLGIVRGLLYAFGIGASGIKISYLVRDCNYIFVNPETYAVKCMLVPVSQRSLAQTDIPEFFRTVISNMRFAEEKDDYVARLLTLINSDQYSNEKLKNLVDEMMEQADVVYTCEQGLKKAIDAPAEPVPKEVKVNRLGVMNNMRPPMPQQPPMPPMPQQPQMQPMPQRPQMQPMPQRPQMQPMPQQSQGMPIPQEMGNLVGQLGMKPVPHLVRKKTGEIINITKPEFVIGKSKTKADYTIDNNSAVSREHCVIIQKDGVNYIKDNNSTNHTYFNGVELQPGKEVLLKHKTEICLGDEEFLFLLRKGE